MQQEKGVGVINHCDFSKHIIIKLHSDYVQNIIIWNLFAFHQII